MTFVPAMCLACDRLRLGDKGSTCAAFPDGIPARILIAGRDHRVEFSGDHGIRFMQRNTDEAREAFADWELVFGSASRVV